MFKSSIGDEIITKKRKFMQVQLTQWSPKNSNLFRFYVKSENQNFGYIQMNFDKIKAIFKGIVFNQ